MIAIARTLATTSRRCHSAAVQVCKRAATSMSVFSIDNQSSHHMMCRKNHSHSCDVIGNHNNIENGSHTRHFASHAVQQQQEDESSGDDEIDREEDLMAAEVHEANERHIGNIQEVRFDYETTEHEIGAFTKCLCGSSECRGTIGGYKYNSDVVHAKYDRKHIANYLLDNNEKGDDAEGEADK